jgi:uncharacterized Zn finger protein
MRLCPNCEERELDVTAVINTFKCWNCGTVWKQLKFEYDKSNDLLIIEELH